MPQSQLGPVHITAWGVKTVLITGGANGTRVDQLIMNNSALISSGALTTKVNLFIVPAAGSASASNAVVSEKSLFKTRNYEFKEFEGFFLATGTTLVIEAIPSAATAATPPSLVVAGSFEHL